MKKSSAVTPEQVMREVTTDIIRRALRVARNLEAFLTPTKRHYTFSGLGAPEERNSINWRTVNLSPGRRILVLVLVAVSFLMKGTPLKNRLYRLMGAHIGRNVEIMQLAWLDHFRPELIFIGDNTLLGAYTRVTVHAYEGRGTFRYGLVEIGANCTIGAGTGIGAILMEDNVRTLPGTTLSPYLARVRAGSVVGYAPPPVRLPAPPGQDRTAPPAEEG